MANLTTQRASRAETELARERGVRTAEEVRFLKWAGWCGIVATAAFLITALAVNLLGTPDAPERAADMATYLDEVAASPAVFWIYAIAGIVFCLLYVPMAVGVSRFLSSRTTVWFGSAAVIAGLAILFPAYVNNLLLPVGLAPAMTETGATGATALFAANEIIAAVSVVVFTVGSLLSLSIGPFLWGVAARRAPEVPPWLARVALLTGITGLVWLVWYIETPILLIVLAVNLLASLVTYGWLSAVLVTRAQRAA